METNYNKLLYEKMQAENETFKDWLLSQEPAEILNHAYEYTIYQDMMLCMEDMKMSKRTIKKQFWLSRSEAQDLQKKAKKACLSEAGLIRLLLKGYEPREKPDADFYEAMKELSAIGNNINQLAVKANSLGFVDAPQLKKEAERWHKFQADMERIYLRPDKSELKWQ